MCLPVHSTIEERMGVIRTFPWQNPGLRLASPDHQRAVDYLATRTADRKQSMREQHLVAARSMKAALKREENIQTSTPKPVGKGAAQSSLPTDKRPSQIGPLSFHRALCVVDQSATCI